MCTYMWLDMPVAPTEWEAGVRSVEFYWLEIYMEMMKPTKL